MDEFQTSEATPAGAAPDPEPQRMLQKILEQIQRQAEERKMADPRNIVFEYSPHVPENQAFVMPRRNFEDGRHRVFLHPSRREALEAVIDALPDPE